MTIKKGHSRLIWIGGVGAAVTTLCCVTPLAGIVLGIVGLTALMSHLDVVLVPALLMFIGLFVYGVVRQRRDRRGSEHQVHALHRDQS